MGQWISQSGSWVRGCCNTFAHSLSAEWVQLCLWPLVTDLLILVANCLEGSKLALNLH